MGQQPAETVGQRVKYLRDNLMLTQSELHHVSGVPLPTIKDIERGATMRPHNATLERLAAALKVSPVYLLLGRSDPPPNPG